MKAVTELTQEEVDDLIKDDEYFIRSLKNILINKTKIEESLDDLVITNEDEVISAIIKLFEPCLLQKQNSNSLKAHLKT